MSYSSIWSPAAIAPVSDLMSSNSCMQRAAYAHHHHHQMAAGGGNGPPTGAACYPSAHQGYHHPSPAAYHPAHHHHPYSNAMDSYQHAMSAAMQQPSAMSAHHAHHSMSSAALNAQMGGNGSGMSNSMNQMGGLHSGSIHGLTGNPHGQTRTSPLNGSLASATAADCGALDYNSAADKAAAAAWTKFQVL